MLLSAMNLWMLYALLSAVCAALVAIFGKLGMAKVDPTLGATVRAIIMALFLVFVTALLNKYESLAGISPRAWLYIVLSGVAGAMSWLFYFIALKHGSAPGVAALDRLSVVFVLALSVALLHEKLTLQSSLGAVLIVAGAILMVV
jgi:transporter family protein